MRVCLARKAKLAKEKKILNFPSPYFDSKLINILHVVSQHYKLYYKQPATDTYTPTTVHLYGTTYYKYYAVLLFKWSKLFVSFERTPIRHSHVASGVKAINNFFWFGAITWGNSVRNDSSFGCSRLCAFLTCSHHWFGLTFRFQQIRCRVGIAT